MKPQFLHKIQMKDGNFFSAYFLSDTFLSSECSSERNSIFSLSKNLTDNKMAVFLTSDFSETFIVKYEKIASFNINELFKIDDELYNASIYSCDYLNFPEKIIFSPLLLTGSVNLEKEEPCYNYSCSYPFRSILVDGNNAFLITDLHYEYNHVSKLYSLHMFNFLKFSIVDNKNFVSFLEPQKIKFVELNNALSFKDDDFFCCERKYTSRKELVNSVFDFLSLAGFKRFYIVNKNKSLNNHKFLL